MGEILAFVGGLIVATTVWVPIAAFLYGRAFNEGWFAAGKLAIKIRDRERAKNLQREVTVQSSSDLSPSLDSKTD